MPASCAPGALAKLIVKDGASAGSAPAYDWTAGNRYAYRFERETLGSKSELRIGNGITGDRSPDANQVREGANDVGGTLEMDCTPGGWLTWLPRILGGTFSGTSITVANSLSAFGMLIAKSVTKDIELRDCIVDRWLLHGLAVPGDQPPEPLTQQLDIVGKSQKEPAVEYAPWTFPTISLGSGTAYSPYVMSDADPTNAQPGDVTIGGVANLQLKEFWLHFNNFAKRRWVNSQNATLICPQSRAIVLVTRLAYDGTVADFDRAALGTNTGSLKFTNSTVSTQFSFANLKRPKRSAFVLGKTELDITVQWMAFPTADGATKELVIVNDSTP
jgi:hypothetical protein